MDNYNLGEKQQQFAEIIWDNQPMTTRQATELCEEALGWKRTTTYTMLKGLCDRGIFQNRDGTVVACMSREDFKAAQGRAFVEEQFDGSLPRFLAAFTRRRKLKDSEIEELKKLIREHEEEEV